MGGEAQKGEKRGGKRRGGGKECSIKSQESERGDRLARGRGKPLR